jgi:hypothetical protein
MKSITTRHYKSSIFRIEEISNGYLSVFTLTIDNTQITMKGTDLAFLIMEAEGFVDRGGEIAKKGGFFLSSQHYYDQEL